jgi:TolB-like protein
MRSRFSILMVLVALSSMGASLHAQEPDRRPGIAVMPFNSGGSIGPNREDMTALGVGVQQMLITELSQNPALRIIERGALQQVLQEQDLVTAERVDAATAAQLGRLVGARYMVLGGFTDIYGQMRMDARIVDVETGEVLRTEQVQNRRERFYPMLVELAAALTRGADLPPLAARGERDRRARRIPPEAAALYSHALRHQDAGETDRAVELYQRLVREFPQLTEAREALRQITAPAT